MNIGYISLWFERGQSYVTKNLMDATEKKHTNFLLVRGAPSLPLPENHLINKDYNITKETFTTWVKENKLDYIVFNEELQWGLNQEENLILLAKELGIKTIGFVNWETFNTKKLENYECYDTLICQTNAFYEYAKRHGLQNLKRVPWGVDIEKFSPLDVPSSPVILFHPAGWGGVHNRKNTQAVIDAFNKLPKNDNIKLLITDQRLKPGEQRSKDGKIKIIGGTLTQESLIELYRNSHAVILPSKWEGLGIPFFEALACGKPVVTLNAPPMNEIIIDNVNGCIAKVKATEMYNNIFVPGFLVDERDLAKKMLIVSTKPIQKLLSNNSRKMAEEKYDWQKNKEIYLEIFKNE